MQIIFLVLQVMCEASQRVSPVTCEAVSNVWTSGTILSTAEGAWRKMIVGDNG